MSCIFVLLILFFSSASQASAQIVGNPARFWDVQSIDTMKYSRDRSREFLGDTTSANQTIVQQIALIAGTGATHVAIATPYDSEFLPILRLWVQAAHEHHLKVWFRGNWSGWEGWFNYPSISRAEHLDKTKTFIEANSDLFQDGDIFTACPECENGGPGDPRSETDLAGYRNFLIAEHTMLEAEFKKLGKEIRVNYNSMNKDVAQLVMDTETTRKLGNIVAIDHYIASAAQMASDSSRLAELSLGKIVLSEFGSPIPDIHGSQTDDEQARWLDDALFGLVPKSEVVALNYWTSFDGSTALWKKGGSEKLAVSVLKKYFIPKSVTGVIFDEKRKPLQYAQVISPYRTVLTDESGSFVIPYLFDDERIVVRKIDYREAEFLVSDVAGRDLSLSLVPLKIISLAGFFSWVTNLLGL